MTARSRPVEVVGITDAVDVAVGGGQSCAVVTSGELFCWGGNWAGQLGDESLHGRLIPTLVAGIDDALSVTAAGDHTCAVRASGDLLRWGANTSGQIGDSTTVERLTPTPVSGLSSVQEVVAGGSNVAEHTCAIFNTSDLACWGSNSAGQLGLGSISIEVAPVETMGPTL